MAIDKCLDVDDDLLAHVDATLDGGRAHVGQQDHMGQRQQFGIDRRFVLENIKAGAGNLVSLEHSGQGIFIDHLTARGVDHIGMGPQ